MTNNCDSRAVVRMRALTTLWMNPVGRIEKQNRYAFLMRFVHSMRWAIRALLAFFLIEDKICQRFYRIAPVVAGFVVLWCWWCGDFSIRCSCTCLMLAIQSLISLKKNGGALASTRKHGKWALWVINILVRVRIPPFFNRFGSACFAFICRCCVTMFFSFLSLSLSSGLSRTRIRNVEVKCHFETAHTQKKIGGCILECVMLLRQILTLPMHFLFHAISWRDIPWKHIFWSCLFLTFCWLFVERQHTCVKVMLFCISHSHLNISFSVFLWVSLLRDLAFASQSQLLFCLWNWSHDAKNYEKSSENTVEAYNVCVCVQSTSS